MGVSRWERDRSACMSSHTSQTSVHSNAVWDKDMTTGLPSPGSPPSFFSFLVVTVAFAGLEAAPPVQAPRKVGQPPHCAREGTARIPSDRIVDGKRLRREGARIPSDRIVDGRRMRLAAGGRDSPCQSTPCVQRRPSGPLWARTCMVSQTPFARRVTLHHSTSKSITKSQHTAFLPLAWHLSLCDLGRSHEQNPAQDIP